MPLRGHSADKKNLILSSLSLRFRIHAGDEPFKKKKRFAQIAGNAKYTSPTIQNKILGIASFMMVKEIWLRPMKAFYLLPMNPAMIFSKKALRIFS